jgi:ABC-type molybdate transport system substrate-binding protein
VVGSTQQSAAQKFIEFLQTPKAQAILRKYGFGQ